MSRNPKNISGFPKIWFAIGLQIPVSKNFDLGFEILVSVQYPIPNHPYVGQMVAVVFPPKEHKNQHMGFIFNRTKREVNLKSGLFWIKEKVLEACGPPINKEISINDSARMVGLDP